MSSKVKTTSLFTEDVLKTIVKSIQEWKGQEIFFGASLNADKKINQVKILSRGNEHCAPVIFEEAIKYEAVIHNHPSSILEPSDADLEIASSLGNYSTAFFIINNDATLFSTIIDLHEEKGITPLVVKEILSQFEKESVVAKSFNKFEQRNSQIKMAHGVCETFNKGGIFLCEATTGTGKSMAYLIPSIIWSIQNGEKVVISTNTINLQQQLFEKDIPRLISALKLEKYHYQIVKGRNNYLCMRKMVSESVTLSQEFLSTNEGESYDFFDFNYDFEKEKKLILDWGKQTKTGDKSELSFVPKSDAWSLFASESDTCRKGNCSFQNECWYHLAKKEYFNANLLIANHHILCADAEIKQKTGKFSSQAVLPSYSRLILDEAHNLEETASAWFGASASTLGIAKTLNLLARMNRKGKISGGNLYQILHESHRILNDPRLMERIEEQISIFSSQRMQYDEKTRDFLKEIEAGLSKVSSEDGNENRIRIDRTLQGRSFYKEALHDPIDRWAGELGLFTGSCNQLLLILKENESNSEELEKLLIELEAYTNRLQSSRDVFLKILEEPSAEHVNWAELKKWKKKSFLFSVNITPLSVAESLKNALYLKLKTIVMTSATLTDNQNFSFFKTRCGLSLPGNPPLYEMKLPHNFFYKEQCVFYLPENKHTPSLSFEAFATSQIIASCKAYRGKTMVLFTSYRQMTQIRTMLEPGLQPLGFNLLCQGDAPRYDLIETFSKREGSVLLGVNSFWEGVDIPGSPLSSLFIVKLPFSVPTEPITTARAEQIDINGGNSFQDFFLPQAILRFKQGFGRLIRSSSDSGVFTVLDDRISSKPYGMFFKNALPEMRTVRGDDFAVAKSLLERVS